MNQLSTGNILDVADQGKANSLRIGSLCVGDEGGGEILSSSPLYLLASEIVDIVTKGYEQ